MFSPQIRKFLKNIKIGLSIKIQKWEAMVMKMVKYGTGIPLKDWGRFVWMGNLGRVGISGRIKLNGIWSHSLELGEKKL